MEFATDTVDAALVSIQPQMLHAAVVTQLQRMIVEGTLVPGTRLNERMLCDIMAGPPGTAHIGPPT